MSRAPAGSSQKQHAVDYASVEDRVPPSSSLDATLTADERESGIALLQASMQAKRPQVSAACQPCRKRKTKCDGQRPCSFCVKRSVPCQYEVDVGETYMQASKRKYDEMAQAHDVYVELFSIMSRQSRRETEDTVHLIKSGRSPEAILRFIKTAKQRFRPLDTDELSRQCFVINLAHSTGSLQAIDEFATSVLDSIARIALPAPDEWLVYANRIIQLSDMLQTRPRGIQRKEIKRPSLPHASAPEPTDEPTMLEYHVTDHALSSDDDLSAESGAPCQVFATPWTSISSSDDAVSHLVSLYFAWINPAWRFVEKDLFLHGMRSQRLDSEFCSPFLVNSICAIASLHSEHDVAFPQPDRDRLSRGQHFHDEALRLWALEDHCPNLTNVQALCVLSLDSNYRAKDKLGLAFMPVAQQLIESLPVGWDEQRCTAEGVSTRDYERARLAAHWTVKCTHIIMQIAFLNEEKASPPSAGVPKIYDVFDDYVETWTGYPLTSTIVHHRPTIYLRERCRLAKLFYEVHHLIYTVDGRQLLSTSAYADAVDGISRSMQQWYHHLPFELHYTWPMSVAVWELHASYNAVLMIFWLAARTRFLSGRDLRKDDHASANQDEKLRSQLAEEKLSDSIRLAYKAAEMLRDFRQRFGLKISPAWLLQLQAVAASVLLLDPVLSQSSTASLRTDTGDDSSPFENSHSAFDEVFRTLLGTAVEVMIARGIARMVYHTALEQRVALSRAARSILQVMSDTAWNPKDVQLVNSTFPNFAATEPWSEDERLTELLLKWEKLDV